MANVYLCPTHGDLLAGFKKCYLKKTVDAPECSIWDFNGNGIVQTLDQSILANSIQRGVCPICGAELREAEVEQPKPSTWLWVLLGLGVLMVIAAVGIGLK